MHAGRMALGLAAAGALGWSAARAGADDGGAAGAVTGAFGGPVVAPLPEGGARVAGAAFMGYRGRDGQSTGAVLTLAPWRAVFLRAGGELTPWSQDGGVRLLWGAGLESARPGSAFLHVHDWGPVRPGERFTLRHAEASAGYKLPAGCLGPLCLAPAVYATVPFEGGPYAGARAALTLWGSWYVMGGFGRTVPGVLERARDAAPAPAWRLGWSVGRWSGRTGALFVTYRDELALDRLRTPGVKDRQGRGALMAGALWTR
ncbi:hypothetical protein ACOQFB_02705 [Anaeromyxobacter sp. Red801]